MARKYEEDAYVKCPYYRKENSTEIKCVGICGDHTTSDFSCKKSKEGYKDDFCMGLYWNCPLFIALDVDGK